MRGAFVWVLAAATWLGGSTAGAEVFDAYCGAAGALCAFTVSIDALEVGGGRYTVDIDTGHLTLEQPTYFGLDDGTYAGVDYIRGQAGRAIDFAVTGLAPSARSFSFVFSLPIALTGLIGARSSALYALTATSAAGARIEPRPGSNVIVAQDVDTARGGAALGKGVDVGGAFAVTVGPATEVSPDFDAFGTLIGSPAYDTMIVRADFSLSEEAHAAVFGFVEQVPVPEPTTAVLAALGLVGAGFMRYRQRRRRRGWGFTA